MKTNQMMHVDLGGFRLDIEHKTGLGNLTSLWAYGNELRVKAGKSPLGLDNYLRMPEVCEYIVEIERFLQNAVDSKGESSLVVNTGLEPRENSASTEISARESKDRDKLSIEYSARGNTAKVVGGKLTCLKTKRGRYAGTWANIYILIDAAMKLDPAFKVRVVDTFINGKILEYRDSSGNHYKEMCAAMGNAGIVTDPLDYARVAKSITFACLGTTEKEQWNTATKEQLQRRDQIELFLSQAITAGFITGLNMAFEYVRQQRLT